MGFFECLDITYYNSSVECGKASHSHALVSMERSEKNSFSSNSNYGWVAGFVIMSLFIFYSRLFLGLYIYIYFKFTITSSERDLNLIHIGSGFFFHFIHCA